MLLCLFGPLLFDLLVGRAPVVMFKESCYTLVIPSYSFCQAKTNWSCKELIAKCNVLGRGEARALRKLGKAKEKIKKLKARIQELKTAVEVKDNEVSRALKASKKTILEGCLE
ncbi:hypothetical protein LOK49_LG11G00154 [Camellia lanceoleosa]|uniref:Uncharacterized protein n=1 Tax=Camellia lanceoleosa TaxID=1840588 RepID=A0ACC0FXP0_9ERIC|nr:hypothetical protein LOK49_LG11G00154 [Camellia lanceoleosa]